MIVSRASGAPVIAGAIEYAATLVRNKVFDIAHDEFKKAEKAGLKDILEARKAASKPAAAEEEVKAPPKEVVTAEIAGIEVLDLGGRCTRPLEGRNLCRKRHGLHRPMVMISEANEEKGKEILKAAGYIG